ncbi:MAG: DUF423 domain-containing protein [Planctomycetes bacterium]|nr:DUF423 domain-containing protein [Planctomycetota bacterium]
MNTYPAHRHPFQPILVLIAALSGAISVGIGAMGAHSLPKQLESRGYPDSVVQKKLDQCELGVRYQLFHTIALLALGLSPLAIPTTIEPAGTSPPKPMRGVKVAAFLWLLGICCFSGGLYSMVFADQIIHWSIVPLGGMMLILGWLALAATALVATLRAPNRNGS